MKTPTVFLVTLLCMIGFMMTACAPSESVKTAKPDINGIYKKDVITGAAGELAPIVFNDQVYFFSFGRDTVDLSGGFVKIQKYPSLEVVHSFPFPFGYGSVIVENGTIHIFAVSNSDPGNRIITIQSDDMYNWTAPVTVFTAPMNQTLYNTSPTKTDSGYAMAYEIHEESNRAWWHVRFLSSTDLVNWTTAGDKYDRTNSSACPMFRYVDGWYYLFTTGDNYALTGARYQTFVTRSKDLVNFEDSPIVALSSAGRLDEGNNNSDLDTIEYNGQLIVVYGAGDQVTWGLMKHGIFNGTLSQFVNQFFKGE